MRLAYIEDEPKNTAFFRKSLAAHYPDIEVVTFEGPESFRRYVEAGDNPPDVIISDYMLLNPEDPGIGRDVLQIRDCYLPRVRFAFMTSFPGGKPVNDAVLGREDEIPIIEKLLDPLRQYLDSI